MIILRIGGRPGGGLLFFTATNFKPVRLKIKRENFSKLTNVHVYKLVGQNSINSRKGRDINLKKSRKNKKDMLLFVIIITRERGGGGE